MEHIHSICRGKSELYVECICLVRIRFRTRDISKFWKLKKKTTADTRIKKRWRAHRNAILSATWTSDGTTVFCSSADRKRFCSFFLKTVNFSNEDNCKEKIKWLSTQLTYIDFQVEKLTVYDKKSGKTSKKINFIMERCKTSQLVSTRWYSEVFSDFTCYTFCYRIFKLFS